MYDEFLKKNTFGPRDINVSWAFFNGGGDVAHGGAHGCCHWWYWAFSGGDVAHGSGAVSFAGGDGMWHWAVMSLSWLSGNSIN